MCLLRTGNPFECCNLRLEIDLCCYQKSLMFWPFLCQACPGQGWACICLGMEVLYETKEGLGPFKRVLEERQSENHRDEGQMASKQDDSELGRGPAGPSALITLQRRSLQSVAAVGRFG